MRVRDSDIVTGDAASVMSEAEGGMYVVGHEDGAGVSVGHGA